MRVRIREAGVVRVLLALAMATACAAASAQDRRCLADPNDPAATSRCSVAPGSPAAVRNLGDGQLPGAGQKVCAFFDARTNRCLTVRPDTRDYDAAVQVGVDAAMMGMQVQADAIQRAKEMGVLNGFGQRLTNVPVPTAAPASGTTECLDDLETRFRANAGRSPNASERAVVTMLCR